MLVDGVVTNTSTYPMRVVLVGCISVTDVNTGDAAVYNGVARASVTTPGGTVFGDTTIDMRPPMVNSPSDKRQVTVTVVSRPLLPGESATMNVNYVASILSPSSDDINDPSFTALVWGQYSSVRL